MPPSDIGRAQARAVRLLTVRGRSECELRRRLLRAGFDEHVVEDVVDWCRRLGYVDDARFAADWVEYRILHGPRGRRLLRQELREKGVEASLVERTLEEALPLETERRLCVETARRRLGRLRRLEPEVRRRRLVAFLQRRGFSYDDIRHALAEVDTFSDTE